MRLNSYFFVAPHLSNHLSMHVYVEAHSGFLAPWSTLVAFKDAGAREKWYRNGAEIELQLQKRILRSKSGGSSLRYFDGATMSSYQVPSRAFEDVHCRQESKPQDCVNTEWFGQTNASDTNNTAAYNPVAERRTRDSLHSREFVHNIRDWKEVLLN